MGIADHQSVLIHTPHMKHLNVLCDLSIFFRYWEARCIALLPCDGLFVSSSSSSLLLLLLHHAGLVKIYSDMEPHRRMAIAKHLMIPGAFWDQHSSASLASLHPELTHRQNSPGYLTLQSTRSRELF